METLPEMFAFARIAMSKHVVVVYGTSIFTSKFYINLPNESPDGKNNSDPTSGSRHHLRTPKTPLIITALSY